MFLVLANLYSEPAAPGLTISASEAPLALPSVPSGDQRDRTWGWLTPCRTEEDVEGRKTGLVHLIGCDLLSHHPPVTLCLKGYFLALVLISAIHQQILTACCPLFWVLGIWWA